jgi:hypothetical protein
MPAYSPEFNSIETLWAVVKGRIKNELNSVARYVKLDEDDFEEMLQELMNNVTSKEAIALCSSNRSTLHRYLSNIRDKNINDADVEEILAQPDPQVHISDNEDLEEV